MNDPLSLFKELVKLAKEIGPKLILTQAVQTGMVDHTRNFVPKTKFDLIIIDYIDRLSPIEKKKIIDEHTKDS